MNPWLAILLVNAILIAFLVGLKYAQRRFDLHPELTRKMVHVGMGIVTLSFPYLFHETWPVAVLALSSILLLASVRNFEVIRRQFGSVLGSVGRSSLGEIYFPISVLTVFAMAAGNTVLYVVPILVLTLADATGALIGIEYGKVKYETDDGAKSWEGSTSFFITAFLSVHIPVLLMTNSGRAESLLIALSLALVIMLMEAISWRGLDNLFIPLTTFVMLKVYLTLSEEALIERLIVIVIIVLAMLWWRRLTVLTLSAVIGAALVLYTSWALGDWHWLIGPAMMFFGYSILAPIRQAGHPAQTVHGVFCVAVSSLFWMFLAKSLDCTNLIFPYGVAYASHLGMVSLTYLAKLPSCSYPGVKATLLGYSIPALPYVWVWRENHHEFHLALTGLALVAAAVFAFARLQPNLHLSPNDEGRWLRQGIIGMIVSVVAFVVITLIEPWSRTF